MGIIAATGISAYYGIKLGDKVGSYLPHSYMIPEIAQGIAAFSLGMIGNEISRKILRVSSKISEGEAYSIASLNAFANASNESRKITRDRSLEEISNNLIEVRVAVGDKVCLGSGLMITADGYIITAHHVIKDLIGNGGRATVKTQDNLVYNVPRENVWFNKSTDIAIIKALKPLSSPAPVKILIDQKCDLQNGQEIRVLGFRDGQKYNTLGMITHSNYNWQQDDGNIVYDLFQTDARGKGGQSGGVIVNGLGELVGIVVYSSSSPGEEIGRMGGAKISNALSYINQIAAKRSSKFFN